MQKSTAGSSRRVIKSKVIRPVGITKTHTDVRGLRRMVLETLGYKAIGVHRQAVDMRISQMLEGKETGQFCRY